MRLFVVNVGVNVTDAAERGLRSQIFPDETFELVPIKESHRFVSCEQIPRYCDLPSLTGRGATLATFVPSGVAAYRAHLDPEFETFTYGDILSSRAANLRNVIAGNQLWFLARLWAHDGHRWTGPSAFYFIGVFEVEANILISRGISPCDIPGDLKDRIRRNAHYKRLVFAGDRSAFRVITGGRPGSFRFGRALHVTPEVAGHVFGGSYDPRDGLYRTGPKVLTNRNGRPRRFETFGSIIRTVQPFLNSEIPEHRGHLDVLAKLASAHARGIHSPD